MTSFGSQEYYEPTPQTLDDLETAILHASALPLGTTERLKRVAVYSDEETDVRVDAGLSEKLKFGSNASRKASGNLRFTAGSPYTDLGVFDREDSDYALKALEIQSRVSGMVDRGADFEDAAWFCRAGALLDVPSDMVMQGIRRLVNETPFDVMDYSKRYLNVLSPDFLLSYSRFSGNAYFDKHVKIAAGSDFAKESVSFTDRLGNLEYRFRRLHSGEMELYEGMRGVSEAALSHYRTTGQLALTEQSATKFTQALRGATFMLRAA
jgi:hypothetical protein